jgi:hypothetical protein
MAIRLMADDVFLAEVFDSDHGVRHNGQGAKGEEQREGRVTTLPLPDRATLWHRGRR